MTTPKHTVEHDEKPSERITYALQALREHEAREGCRVDMGMFRRIEGGVCFACLGGSARLKRDGLYAHITDDPGLVDGPWITDYEQSLDLARIGYISGMFEDMELDFHNGTPFNRDIVSYYQDRDQFYVEMEQLADDLREAGY